MSQESNKQTDEERILELKIKMWGCVAKNLLHEKVNPYEINADDIEDHQGRQSKAIRLLGDCITYLRDSPTRYSISDRKIYRVNNFQESIGSSVEPIFASSLPEIHDLIFTGLPEEQDDMDRIGYLDIDQLPPLNALYSYWNRDHFHFIKSSCGNSNQVYDDVFAYPKTLLGQRTNNMLTALIEHYLDNTYHTRIETYLGLPCDSVKIDDNFQLDIRNFSASSHNFSKKAFFGKTGFLKEYTHYMEYFQALLKSLSTFDLYVKQNGGYKAITKRMRIESIKELLNMAPLHVFSKLKEENNYNARFRGAKKIFENPFVFTFILRYSQDFNYETLYTDNHPLLNIQRDRALSVYDEEFEADKNEVAFINTMKG